MENQMQYVQHDLLLHSEVKPTPELMNDAQKLQAQLERDDISWDEMLLLRRDDPNDLRYANYEDLCENTHCKTFSAIILRWTSPMGWPSSSRKSSTATSSKRHIWIDDESRLQSPNSRLAESQPTPTRTALFVVRPTIKVEAQ
jgi:hypothetical protein